VANSAERSISHPVVSVHELELAARAVLPQGIYDYFAAEQRRKKPSPPITRRFDDGSSTTTFLPV